MIELKNVSKTYISKKGSPCKALDNINLTMEEKGIIFLLGKSGSGKSTLLNVLGGLDTIDQGSIKINNSELTKLDKDQLDAYRNTCVGFIFQDYNLLDNLNVYENIALSCELQRKPIEKREIDQLLKKMDLDNLGSRKLNELSGGQKQRIAIARALIKNPEIILADEPTGNLDQKSSNQIFHILKEISQKKLVIVVTHNEEAAMKYADRIIKIQDGQIEENEPKTITKTKELKLESSKLPYSYILKMTRKNITAKPFKITMSIILFAFALCLVGLSISILSYQENTLIINVMDQNNNPFFHLKKIEQTNYGKKELNLTKQDLKELEILTENIVNPSYQIYDFGSPLSFKWIKDSGHGQFYDKYFEIKEFVEIKQNNLFDNIIGSIPKNENELLIHKYLAENITKFGVKDELDNPYFPTDIFAIVDDHKALKLGDNIIYISGIIDDDNTLFENNIRTDRWGPYLPYFIEKDYKKKAEIVYVKGFTQIAKTTINKEDFLTNLSLQGSFYETNLFPLNKEIKYVTENSIETTNQLSKNNIIISLSLLKKLDPKLDVEYRMYFSSYDETEENVLDFLKEKLQSINLENFSFSLNQRQENESIELQKCSILGISLDQTYISNRFIDEYNPKSKILSGVLIKETDKTKLKKVLEKTYRRIPPINNTYIKFEMNFLEDIIDITNGHEKLKLYTAFLTSIIILFAVILCMNIISISINYSKKEIGILKSLGTSEKDIEKIFRYENIILNLISWILGILGFILLSYEINQSYSSRLFYHIDFITMNPIILFIILIVTIILSIIITSVSTKQITKIKPIDAIYDK